jgi:hypothetical protein
LLAAAYGLACHFTGENLLAAWRDERQLARRTLAELDAACAANPRPSEVIVTLTTIPSRLGLIAPTLKSLLRQTARPREIRLCLPPWSEREQRAYVVPEWLHGLRCVTVVRCADEGPATKFLSTLRASPPDQLVLVVDDDRIYHAGLLEALARQAAAAPDRAFAAAGWSAPADLVDRPTTLGARLRGAAHVPVRANQLGAPRRVDVMQGLHGYLVRPRFFDLAALGDFRAAPPAVRTVDDVWISAHCRAEKWVPPLPLAFTDFAPRRDRARREASALGRIHRAARDEDRANSIALRWFRDRWIASS